MNEKSLILGIANFETLIRLTKLDTSHRWYDHIIIPHMRLRDYIGLAGVSKNERHIAHVWGKFFEFAMILVAIWIPLQWYLERKQHLSTPIIDLSSWLIWSFLLIESLTLLALVRDKRNYLQKNWVNWVIIIAVFPPLTGYTPWLVSLRSLQFLIMLRLLLPGWYNVIDILSRNSLGTTLSVAFIVTVLWGVLMSAVDPGIHTPWDGIWWAWETVTTVGYGDVVPTTGLGRFLGALLMLMGVALISLLTANFSAYFISKGTHAIKEEEDELLRVLRDIQIQVSQIQTRLKELEKN